MVTPRYLPFTGGVELHVDQVARRLAARGVAITVLTTDPTGALPSDDLIDGVAVRRVRAWPRRRDYYFAPRVYSEIAHGIWDVVHVQSYQTFVAPLAMLAARRSSTPYLVTFHAGGHSSGFRQALRPLQLALLRPLLARAARLVALAPFEIDDYSRRLHVPREKFVLISNGSDLPPPDAADIRRDDSLIASVGRLERYKGHQHVIAAMPYVLRDRPEARLWIAGSGPYEASLTELADRLGVSKSVEIRAIPIEDRASMASQLARVKVVVSLSEFETQPIAALEALSLGCRLVVANAPGLAPLARKGLARMVSAESEPDQVARVVLDELDRPAVEGSPALPTWDECADALLALYELISNDGAR